MFIISSSSWAEEYTIMTEELPPLSYEENGKITGLSVELVREILKIVDHPDNIAILPWARAYMYAQDKPKHILFAMGRNPVRENLFKWVGPLVSNRTHFYKRRGSDVHIKSMEDAKKVKAIGVVKNDFNHVQLESEGFKNLVINVTVLPNIKMLALDRIDLLPSGEIGLYKAVKKIGVDPNLIERTDVMIFDSKLYIAFSKDTPDSEIEKWQKALDQIKENGIHAKTVNKYLGKIE